ncbi:MAG: hypothetical protein LBU22_05055 [Dysgonamonadaceae bacterium]|jgi:hypothetical protein|nr:hypothetical protein [Dysgonamonadaceae bacterium]
MARPIKETPIVYGQNAIRILKEIENPEPLPKERIEEIKKSHEMFLKTYRSSYAEAGINFAK